MIAVGLIEGEYDKKQDMKLPDREARIDLVDPAAKKPVTTEIADPMEHARRWQTLSTEGDKRFRHLRVVMLNGMTKALAAEIEAVQGKNPETDPMAMAGSLIGMLPQMAGHQGGFEAWDISFAHVRDAMPHVLQLAAEGALHPELVTTSTVAWADAADALLDPGWTKLIIER